MRWRVVWCANGVCPAWLSDCVDVEIDRNRVDAFTRHTSDCPDHAYVVLWRPCSDAAYEQMVALVQRFRTVPEHVHLVYAPYPRFQ